LQKKKRLKKGWGKKGRKERKGQSKNRAKTGRQKGEEERHVIIKQEGRKEGKGKAGSKQAGRKKGK
jgi:hypothetical protein